MSQIHELIKDQTIHTANYKASYAKLKREVKDENTK